VICCTGAEICSSTLNKVDCDELGVLARPLDGVTGVALRSGDITTSREWLDREFDIACFCYYEQSLCQ
jgi:hypothetical protein